MSKLFTVEGSDWRRGFVTAVFGGVWAAIAGIIGSVGFDLFTADWKRIIGLAIVGGFVAGAGYITRKFSTDSEGKVLGVMQVE